MDVHYSVFDDICDNVQIKTYPGLEVIEAVIDSLEEQEADRVIIQATDGDPGRLSWWAPAEEEELHGLLRGAAPRFSVLHFFISTGKTQIYANLINVF